MRHTALKGFCALLLVLTSWGLGRAEDRIVAIGDVHGSYPQLVAILERLGLIDGRRQWIGGSAVLVQAGDIPSRGTRTRECFDLLMDLEAQAQQHQGRVVPLLGNHEPMLLTGDLRYVQPEDFRTFATDQSQKVRERAFADYKAYLARRLARRGVAGAEARVDRRKWMEEHPLGFFELRDAFGPTGKYGRWIRTHDTVAEINGILFLHGGLSPELAFRDLAELNERARSELARFDSLWESLSEKGIIWRYMRQAEAFRAIQEEWAAYNPAKEEGDPGARAEMQALFGLPRWLIVSSEGPLWYRGYATDPEAKLAPYLQSLFARLGIHHIVAAHTITDSRRITPRFQNRIFLIDTGMMFEEKHLGYASALEIQAGKFTAHYSNGQQQAFEPTSLSSAPPASSLTSQQEAH